MSLQTFDQLFDDTKTDRLSRDFFWGLFSPVTCGCGQAIERDLPRFGIDKAGGRPRLFAESPRSRGPSSWRAPGPPIMNPMRGTHGPGSMPGGSVHASWFQPTQVE